MYGRDFRVEFPIDLIPITMGDVCVIVGMDWLSRFGAVIDCERQLVAIRDPSREVLSVYGKGTRYGSAFCSASRARQSLHQGDIGFLAYVSDSWVVLERPSSNYDVSIVGEFPNVFPDELLGGCLLRGRWSSISIWFRGRCPSPRRLIA